MARCRHPNISIVEIGLAYTDHDRENDGTWSHCSRLGDYTGKLVVYCPDCELHKEYSSTRLPKWLNEMLQEAEPLMIMLNQGANTEATSD